MADRNERDIPRGAERTKQREDDRGVDRADHERDQEANPPHTTTGKLTAPKFGSAVSGGGDVEPAPGS